MIKYFYITGDKHGNFNNLLAYDMPQTLPEESAIIILGDAGLNFYFNKTDKRLKQKLENTGFTWYILRGNHESRVAALPDIESAYDQDVGGTIWLQPQWPHIRYFNDTFGIYHIMGLNVLTIGGAYSVDKWWRLERCGLQEENNNPVISGWWNDEQLSGQEKEECLKFLDGAQQPFDLILTHTCPISYEPRDLFIPAVNQNSVDKSMEEFLEVIKNRYQWKIWLFGHYHADRIESLYVQQLYHEVQSLSDIVKFWKDIK